MAYGEAATVTGSVTAHPQVSPGTAFARSAGQGFVGEGFVAEGFVGGSEILSPWITGTVDGTYVQSYEAPMVYVGVRVLLDGQEIPQADLTGRITIRRTIDSPAVSVRLQLVGESYSIYRTVQTWTRTPIEIRFLQGPPGGVLEVVQLSGLVRTCRETLHEGEPALEVDCADLGALYDRYRLCHEVPPYSGLTRGEIAVEVAADAGLSLDVPLGAVYNSPLQLDGERLFAWLAEWGAPEDWHWRWSEDGNTLTAYVPELKEAPMVPDAAWGPADIESIEARPPTDPPSRYVVRGYAALYVDEIGIEVELTRTEVKALYAPVGAVERQQSDGTRVAVDFSQPERLRTVQIIEEERRRRGTTELRSATREHAWYNVAVAKGLTVTNAGQTGDGWDYTVAYVDPDGNFIHFSSERFGLVGERVRDPVYNSELTRVSETERVYRLRRRLHGIRQTGIGEGDPQTAGVGIGADDQSWRIMEGSQRIESYGLAEEFRRSFSHAPSGAALEEVQDEYGFGSPRHALDVAGGHRLYDGTAQADLVANWLKLRTRRKTNILSADGRLRGVVELASGYRELEKLDGAHDFGGAAASNEVSASFRLLERKNIAYIVRGHNQVEEVTYQDGERTSRVILGGLPVPTFLSSSWTRLVQQPLELVVDDPTVEAWFGISQETLDNPYIQAEAEAWTILRRARSRDLARKLTVRRAETHVRPGDTILVRWPPLIHERYLVTEQSLSRDPLQGAADATYVLERPVA